jgi:hypothetical protein
MAQHIPELDTADFPVFAGCPCCHQLLWLDCMSNPGCAGVNECVCIKEEFCCRQGVEPMPIVVGVAEGFLCKIGLPCCSCGLKVPEICMKAKGQCCCFIANAAIPPDADTPMMIAVYGLTCFPVQGCCVPFKDVSGKAAPAANQS